MIILITGKAGSGKDTIADYLVNKYNFKKEFFANTLKKAVKEIFGLTDLQAYDRVEREKVIPYWGRSPRELYQIVGTEVFRDHFDRDIWVKSLKYKVMKDIESNYVISDVRFPNEIECFKTDVKNVLSIKVIRDGYNGNVGLANHESEKYDLDTNITIKNDSTLQDLYKKVDEIVLKYEII